MTPLTIATWNANGVSQNKLELAQFLADRNIDVMLLSETHLTEKYNFQIPGYKFYFTNHPDGRAHGGTGILIRLRIKLHFLGNWQKDCLQCTSINLQCHNGTLTLAAVAHLAAQSLRKNSQHFLTRLVKGFVAAGDWNAKHMYWGSYIAKENSCTTQS